MGRGSKPSLQGSPGHYIASMVPSSAGVRAQGEGAGGPGASGVRGRRRVRELHVAGRRVLRVAVLGPRVAGPSQHACTTVRRRQRVAALWSMGCGGTRDIARFGMKCCSAGYFDQDLLPKLELKCTEG
jgi:hypothetical protein